MSNIGDVATQLSLAPWFMALIIVFLCGWVWRTERLLVRMAEQIRQLSAEVAELNQRLRDIH